MIPGNDFRQARTGIECLTRPDPKDRAGQIVAWAICWPWNFVWTCCVYNPFRYIGEFLLREIQSALFEISNGQFSAIEQDLTLDPAPPPFPIRERQTPPVAGSESSSAETGSVSVSVRTTTNDGPPITASPTTERPTPAPLETVVAETTLDSRLASTVEQKSAPQPENPNGPQSGTNDSLPVNEPQDAGDDEDEQSASYAWAPPEPTAFVAMSNRPLRGVKFENGPRASRGRRSENPGSGSIEPKRDSTGTSADPWFEKHGPDR